MESDIAVKWLENNEIIANPKPPINIINKIITSEKSVKFLGITINNELKFDEHMNALCRKSCQTTKYTLWDKAISYFRKKIYTCE